jgi:hypothetical protein
MLALTSLLPIVFKVIKNPIILLTLLVFILCSMLYYTHQNKEMWKNTAKQKDVILNTQQKEYKDAQGRWVNVTHTWQVTARDLKIANDNLNKSLNDKNIQISQQQKELAFIFKLAQEQGRRIKDLESAHVAEMEAINNLMTKLRLFEDSLGNITFIIDSIITKHLVLGFEFIPPDSLAVGHIYRNKIYTLVELRANRRENGNKKWPFGNWLWLWGSETITSVTSEDPDARITNNISIKLNNKTIKQ